MGLPTLRSSGWTSAWARHAHLAAAGAAGQALLIICPCGVHTCCRKAGTCAGAKRETAAGAKPGSGLIPMTCTGHIEDSMPPEQRKATCIVAPYRCPLARYKLRVAARLQAQRRACNPGATRALPRRQNHCLDQLQTDRQQQKAVNFTANRKQTSSTMLNKGLPARGDKLIPQLLHAHTHKIPGCLCRTESKSPNRKLLGKSLRAGARLVLKVRLAALLVVIPRRNRRRACCNGMRRLQWRRPGRQPAAVGMSHANGSKLRPDTQPQSQRHGENSLSHFLSPDNHWVRCGLWEVKPFQNPSKLTSTRATYRDGQDRYALMQLLIM